MITEHTVHKLELPAVLDMLGRHCRFSVGREIAATLRPSGVPRHVETLLDQTGEACRILQQFPELTVGPARDIRDHVDRARKGARLQPAELLLVQDMLRSGREMRRVVQRLPDATDRYPQLVEIVSAIENFSPLEADLARTIGPRGDVLDNASDELSRVRKAVRTAQHRLQERLQGMISGGRYAAALQENLITMRNGRYVVPVRAEARGTVKGIVHDTSASGQTLYIEPFDIVQLNNTWREQQVAEQREVDRILDRLSFAIGDQSDALLRMVAAVATVDLVLAKARLADEMLAHRPRVARMAHRGKPRDDDPSHPNLRIDLIQARHPLIDPDQVVPIDVQLGERFRALLITGPNTGGKTVSLKTVGLLALMAQVGLFIPAEPQSQLSVFPSVFVDIGDEQSIEQSLSTFSSHIRNIIDMLNQVGSDSLVLLDEVGAGTDPQEGSALARAIITELLRRKAMVIATTHYSEVKAFAYATPGVENASVEFDVASLRPTYRLMIGIPGRSNALSIASRLGMPERIVNDATGMLDPGDEDAQQLIDDIRIRRQQVTKELEQARKTEEEARELRRRAARLLREADDRRQNARDEAIAEIQGELADARDVARGLQQYRGQNVSASPDRTEINRSLKAAEERVRETQRRRQPQRVIEIDKAPIRRGDRVRILAFDEEGDVISVDGDDADVQMGSLKVRQPMTRLERIGRSRQRETRSSAGVARDMQASRAPVPMELDIRGKRAEEVGPMVDSYVNDAYLAGMPFVRIIHGKGTGALRSAVRSSLAEVPVVARSESAGQNEGGDGATVAFLRQG